MVQSIILVVIEMVQVIVEHWRLVSVIGGVHYMQSVLFVIFDVGVVAGTLKHLLLLLLLMVEIRSRSSSRRMR